MISVSNQIGTRRRYPRLYSLGFTLIELLVVIAISATLMSLVGPLTVRSFEKAQAKEERLTLKNWLKKESARALYSGQPLKVVLTGKKAILFTSEEPAKKLFERSFNYVFFQPQTIHLSHRGFSEEGQLRYLVHEREFTIDLSLLINGQKVLVEDS